MMDCCVRHRNWRRKEEREGEQSGGREGGRTGSLLQRAEKEGKEGRDSIKANVSTGLDSSQGETEG